MEELLTAVAEHQDNNFRFGAGGTDLMIELKKQPVENLTVINLAQLEDEQFNSIRKNDDLIMIGVLVTANAIVNNVEIHDRFPVLWSAANKLASRQIRQVATVGGNLCTASPAGDIACALTALQAQCEILAADGITRVIPINKFFLDVRKTDLKKNEILRSVFIPKRHNYAKIHSDYIKIGTRRAMECSVISLAYHFLTDEEDRITHAGIAIGSLAPTIKFCQSACEYMIGRNLNKISPSEAETFAAKVSEYASPISDIRASAWYRSEVLFNIAKSIFNY